MSVKFIFAGIVCVLFAFFIDRAGTIIVVAKKGPGWLFLGNNIWYILGPIIFFILLGISLVLIGIVKGKKI